jgi:two-component system, OmpR family, phosphate regulon sensor histidine kinase PhoR
MIFDAPARNTLLFALLCVTLVAANLVGASLIVLILFAVAGLAMIVTAITGTQSEGAEVPKARSREPSEIVFDALSDPALLLSGTRVAYANASAKALFGAHIVDQDIRTGLRHPAVTGMLADPEALGMVEVSGVGDSGQIWEVRVESASSGQRLLHLVDRSARYAAERARVDFVANASHELRTPLATLLGYIETLRDDPSAGGDPVTRERFLGIMDSEAKRMQRLVSDLMSLSRIEAEKHAFPETDVDLAALISRVVGERPKPVALNVATNLPPVKADEIKLSQLLHNLIDNAIRYGGEAEGVRIALVAEPAGRICLSVSDQGEGIAPEHLPRLTERFYRADPARSRAGGGTGLGLAIVKHIAEHHRAVLKIESKLGVGTSVSVSFPAAA